MTSLSTRADEFLTLYTAKDEIDKEQKRLLMAESSDHSEFVAVFGRCRVGKTFLIRETFRDRFCFYHTGLANAGMARQLTEFKKTLCRYGQRKFRTPKDWYDAFDLLGVKRVGDLSICRIEYDVVGGLNESGEGRF